MIDLAPIIFIVTTLIFLSAIAGRIKKIPYPILLVFAGLIIGFVPGVPLVSLDPEMVFLLFLPPLLYRAGWNTSWKDFQASIVPISRLAIGLVLFTTFSVAALAHYFIPGMSWPIAFVLGAIVSPPDAVSATSIISGMGLNRRIVTILEGESLVNDASALIVYRYAIAAVVSSSFVLWKAGLQFLIVASGGILIGFILGYLLCIILKRIKNNPTVETTLLLLVPFVSYPLAERFGVSGVLAVVSTGLVTSWRSSEVISYQGRTQSNAVWDMIVFLLNGIIFILIGLQLSEVVATIEGYKISELILYSLLISATAIVTRIVFIAPAIWFPSLLGNKIHKEEQTFSWKNVLVLSWAGMRGVLSLATAMALPLVMEDGTPLHQRNVILFITFGVILVTLVGQGLTLPILIKGLKIGSSKEQEDEERKLRLMVANSSLDYINDTFKSKDPNEEVIQEIRKLYELRVGWLAGKDFQNRDINVQKQTGNSIFLEQVIKGQLAVTDFKRKLLLRLYRDGNYSVANIRKLEKEMDLDESRLRSQLKTVKDD
ncbi:Na+/H+ antiporter [Flavobacterium johnsoniae]|uniref:Monovalent cation:H+ antiporter, CPA1 family n=1 Tax=Flavobacterium johnsoniae TaxID=986 RepID=A0A1M5URP4_FLAJO|nr:Na+/H+ antiporter [Flavobacterium johnsoniae]SHH65594.1 monovalent cation:H+ antiporter, CPA1 family [Flavobacterium johnsoniae]